MTVLSYRHVHGPSVKASAAPHVIHRYRRNAPRRAPCPHCGRLGRRRQVLPTRTVRGIAYHAVLFVHVTTAEYRAACACSTTFRTYIEGVEPKAHYSNTVREAVLDRLLDDHMNLEQIRQALQRDFFLDLSAGFVHQCLHWKIQQLDLPSYRRWTLEHFSGTLCVDELHLGSYTLLLATDPLHDFPVAFALVSRNDQEHMRRFLGNLRRHGLQPRVVITDGSSLYPTVLATLWPQAEHQLCVFHVLQDINQHVLDAVREEQRRLRRRSGKNRRRRGDRPPRRRTPARGPTLRDQAYFVFKHRYLLVKRADHFTAADRHQLQLLLQYAPALRPVRAFVEEVHHLFASWQTPAQAYRRRQRLCGNVAYAADPHLAKVLAMLAPALFDKMIAFLRSPAGQRVRTNNHVERTNRQLRLFEKIRYRWRRRGAIVRFVVLLVTRQWQRRRTPTERTSPGSSAMPQADPRGRPWQPAPVRSPQQAEPYDQAA